MRLLPDICSRTAMARSVDQKGSVGMPDENRCIPCCRFFAGPNKLRHIKISFLFWNKGIFLRT